MSDKEQWHHSEKYQQWRAFLETLDSNVDPKIWRLTDQLRLVAHELYQVGEQSLAITGLSLPQYRILMMLYFHEQSEGCSALNPSEISERQGTNRNTISALIRSLEERGFVTRHLDENDRRKFNIRLSDNGRALVHQHARQHLQTMSVCFGTLTTAEQDTLAQLLTKVSHQTAAARRQLQES